MNEAVKKAMKKLGDEIFESDRYGTPVSGWVDSCPFEINSRGRLCLKTDFCDWPVVLSSKDLRNLANLVRAVSSDLKNQKKTRKANEEFLASLQEGNLFPKLAVKAMRDLLGVDLADVPVAGVGEDGKLQLVLRYENGHWFKASIRESYFKIESSHGLPKLTNDKREVKEAIDEFVEKEENL